MPRILAALPAVRGSATLRRKLEEGLRRHLGPRFVDLTTRWTADRLDERHLGDLPADPVGRTPRRGRSKGVASASAILASAMRRSPRAHATRTAPA